MKVKLLSLEKKTVGELKVDSAVFDVSARPDIIKRVVDWQLAKARGGNHAVKTVGEVSSTTKKPFRQKGTGNARQGNARGVQRRGGGVAHGPQVRSHAYSLPKKIRAFGLKSALSMKLASGSLHFIDSLELEKPKTSKLLSLLDKFGNGRFFVIDGDTIDINFRLSASSLKVGVVPAVGANVYDIIRSDLVFVSKAALPILEKRLVK